MTTRSQLKSGKPAEEIKESASPNKTDVMFEMLRDIKLNIEATTSVNNELGNKIIELGRRIDEIETSKKESGRDKWRFEADKVSGISPEGANDFTSHTVRVGENATILARLPRGGWLKNPFEEIKFFGRTDKQNPIKFLRRFERTAEYEGVGEIDQLHFFGRCLRGAASTWFDVCDPENMSEAREMFVRHFWNEEHQARFREDIYTGRYHATAGESMSEYVLNIVKQAKLLEPPMSDHELIRCIKRHFGAGISREVRRTTIKNIEEFVGLLDEIELERERSKKLEARQKEAADKSKANANERSVDSKKKPWIKNNNVSANNKFTRNNVASAKTKSDDEAYERENAKDEKNVAAENNKGVAKKENKNVDTATRVDKTASHKNFSARRNVAAVHANDTTEDSEEESKRENRSSEISSAERED